MPQKEYNWKRFWCSRTGTMDLSDGGYLYDPESEWGDIYNPDVKNFFSIAGKRCLALLGEPGIGKSSALKTEYSKAKKKVEKNGGQCLWFDLKAYGNETRLINNLFFNQSVKSWVIGNSDLHLFLDSLDECLMRIETVASILVEELGAFPVERLFLRVACRTAEWPNGLENGLIQLLGEDNFKAYELCPLRRKDVIKAVEQHPLKSDMFLDAIDKAEAVPLAIKPITLNFLINLYRRDGRFPSKQSELYHQGCLILCEDPSESRRDAGRVGFLSAAQRLVVAARIAAIMIFSNRYAVWTNIDLGEVPLEDVKMDDLCNGIEPIGDNSLPISEPAIKETLSTGLFSSRGQNRIGWGHKNYTEYLAAYYIVNKEVKTIQILSLLLSSDDLESKLIPQLHGVAAWISSMQPKVFNEIVKRNPETLLSSDILTADIQVRAALVESFIQQYEKKEFYWGTYDFHRYLYKLRHPDLGEQLKPYLHYKNKDHLSRIIAIDIAEACNVSELHEYLLKIALDDDEPISVRENAASALSKVGDEKVKIKLKPLAIEPVAADKHDGLKGYALQCLWPNQLSAKELFECLRFPKRENFVGKYHMFLTHELIENVKADDLPIALDWVLQLGESYVLPQPFRELSKLIMLKSWDYLEQKSILNKFAHLVLQLAKNYNSLEFDDPQNYQKKINIFQNHKKRKKLLKEVVSILATTGDDSEKCSFDLVFLRTPMVLKEDIPWLISMVTETNSDKEKEIWAHLTARVYHPHDVHHTSLILQAAEVHRSLRVAFKWLVEPIKLNSTESNRLKENYYKQLARKEKNNLRPLLDPPQK